MVWNVWPKSLKQDVKPDSASLQDCEHSLEKLERSVYDLEESVQKLHKAVFKNNNGNHD